MNGNGNPSGGASRASKNVFYSKGKSSGKMPRLSYSAKSARVGKDIGKPGKNFAKIAAKAGAKYGSAQAGKRVAGAILRNLRNK